MNDRIAYEIKILINQKKYKDYIENKLGNKVKDIINRGISKLNLKIFIEDYLNIDNKLKEIKEKFVGKIDSLNFIIIGEMGADKKANPRVITFILKSGNEIKCDTNKNQQSSYEDSENYLQETSDTCGVPSVAKVEKQLVVVEFTSFQDTIMFHKRGRFGLEKVQNSEIHVKVVLDMEYGNI